MYIPGPILSGLSACGSLNTPTIEAAVAKMRSSHLQLLDIIHSNLRAANAPMRLLDSLKGLKGSEQGKEPDYFTRIENFRNATEMALDTQHEGFLALHNESMWERECENTPKAIPEKMRVAAMMCSRSGEHEVALSLLRQAYLRTEEASSAQQAQAQMTGDLISSTDHGHLRRLPSSLKMANEEELIRNQGEGFFDVLQRLNRRASASLPPAQALALSDAFPKMVSEYKGTGAVIDVSALYTSSAYARHREGDTAALGELGLDQRTVDAILERLDHGIEAKLGYDYSVG